MGLNYGRDQGPIKKQIQGECLRINTGKLPDCIVEIEEKCKFILTPVSSLDDWKNGSAYLSFMLLLGSLDL